MFLKNEFLYVLIVLFVFSDIGNDHQEIFYMSDPTTKKLKLDQVDEMWCDRILLSIYFKSLFLKFVHLVITLYILLPISLSY